MSNYFGLLVFLVICNLLACLLIFLAYLFAPKSGNIEKLSAYECGFEPFSDARLNFDVHFYVVAVLFIIFDLEVSFLIPWAFAVNEIGRNGYFAFLIFIALLTVGFFFEWKLKALDWSSAS